MAEDTMNSEGLTFGEWVCAAGLAKFGYLGRDGLWPYTTSHTRHLSPSDPCGYYFSPTRAEQLRKSKYPGYWSSGYFVYRVSSSRTHYSKKIRDAWKNGEDPTEWRK